jgi:2-polyprenyl-3-methyl-5-hydroxy-6-metoxy-1,4-benzoquinol methylase
MDAQARVDLAERVPAGSRAVLDVGCSRGATAQVLRQRGVEWILGIEPDPDDAAAAARSCDRGLPVRLDDVREDFPGRFDAVLFGDVLEHLGDPTQALVRVRPWLSPRGVVVASLPNVGHWSVIADLLAGRFDYVPYSILSGTHLRFFTRRTAQDLFEACGFRVDALHPVRVAPSPQGAGRFAKLAAFPGASPDLDVAEFVIVASPDGHL